MTLKKELVRVSLHGCVEPHEIVEVNETPQYKVLGFEGTVNPSDLGVYVELDKPFFQKKDRYSLFNVNYSLSGDIPRVEFTIEYNRNGNLITKSVVGIFNEGTNLLPTLMNIPFDFPECVSSKIFHLLKRENILEKPKFGFERLSDEVKIENAKRFEALHKDPFFAHLEGVENALDEEYLKLWNEYIQEEVSGDIFAEETPYIEISSHVCKSGHAEIFEPALGDDEDIIFAEEATPVFNWSLFSVMAELGSYDDIICVDGCSNSVLYWAEKVLDEKDIFKRCKLFEKVY